MKSLFFILALITTASAVQIITPNAVVKEEITWPPYLYDTIVNPLTPKKIYLGRVLFYDPVLSVDSTISCASCHSQYTAFTHVDHKLSHGVFDLVGDRNSPSLMNLAYQSQFMWDGRIHNLNAQPLAPISEADEMGETIEHVVYKLNQIPAYRKLFMEVYGDSIITGEHMAKAIGAFMATIESKNAKYDQVLNGTAEFTEQEAKGYELFKQNCASCHQEPLFTTNEFVWNGLPLDTALNDLGRISIKQPLPATYQQEGETHQYHDSTAILLPEQRWVILNGFTPLNEHTILPKELVPEKKDIKYNKFTDSFD